MGVSDRLDVLLVDYQQVCDDIRTHDNTHTLGFTLLVASVAGVLTVIARGKEVDVSLALILPIFILAPTMYIVWKHGESALRGQYLKRLSAEIRKELEIVRGEGSAAFDEGIPLFSLDRFIAQHGGDIRFLRSAFILNCILALGFVATFLKVLHFSVFVLLSANIPLCLALLSVSLYIVIVCMIAFYYWRYYMGASARFEEYALFDPTGFSRGEKIAR